MDHRSFLDLAPDLLCAIDNEGRFLEVNPAWEKALGYSPDELRGRMVTDIVDATHREVVLAMLDRARGAEGGNKGFQARFTHKNGSIKWLVWSCAAVPGDEMLVAIARDVTEALKRDEAHVRQLRTLMSSTSDLTALINLEGEVTYMNPAGLTMIGRRSHGRRTIQLTDFLQEEGSRSFTTTIRPAVFRDGLWAGELSLFSEKGAQIPVSMVMILIRDEAGEPEALGVIARDLTEHKVMEAALKQAIRAMSTPILQIWKGVLTLPVIGELDAARASQMMESLLAAIMKTRCKVAILDLTGVDAVDTSTVNHLFQMASAASLLGSTCVVSGISSQVAQTVATLGVDLSRLRAFSTLQEALAFAMRSVENRG